MEAVNETDTRRAQWQVDLAAAIRKPDTLIRRLGLPDQLSHSVARGAMSFRLLVPESFLARMEFGNVGDPLLRQVLPTGDELADAPGYSADAVNELPARPAPGLIRKYPGRVLLIAHGACAVHCRYCFRREYPYAQEPRRADEWQPAFDVIESDPTIREVILSGGDPLMLTDSRLGEMIERIQAISHVDRLRIHTRLPIVLPSRVTSGLITMLTESRLQSIVVVHANHANELVGDCRAALRKIVSSGIPTLNQAVLLRGVNDSVDAQIALSEKLCGTGVMPYYLNQLDRVTGAAHFEVPFTEGVRIIERMRERLPGYAVPRYVADEPGVPHKTVIR